MLVNGILFSLLAASAPPGDRCDGCKCSGNLTTVDNLCRAHLQQTSQTFWTCLLCFLRSCSLGMEGPGEVYETCRQILPEERFRSLSRLFGTSRTRLANSQSSPPCQVLFSTQCIALGGVSDASRCGLIRLRRLRDVAVLLLALAT